MDELSIVVYILFFSISLCICAINQKYFESLLVKQLTVKRGIVSRIRITNKLLVIIFFIIILPLLMAAWRGKYVGADTENYINMFYTIESIDNFFQGYKELKIEFLYYLLCYSISHLCGNVQIYLALFQILAFLPVMVIALKKCDQFPVWMVLGVYYFMFYNDSLNGMRQYIATGCLVLAFLYYEEKNAKAAIILFIIAAGFHSSAIIIGIGFFILLTILKSKARSINKGICILLLFIAFTYAQSIAEFLIGIGALPIRYFYYIKVFFLRTVESDWIIQGISMGALFEILARLAVTIPFALYSKKKGYNNYLFMTIIGLLVYSLCLYLFHTSYGVRLTIYFDYFYLLLIPQLNLVTKIKIRSKFFKYHFLEVAFLIIYWIIHTTILGSSGSIPYSIY